MSIARKILMGAAGAGGDKTYVDDVFSTYLYEGVGSGYNDISVNNGIDLSGEGGLVWVKNRDDSKGHVLADTVRGATKTLYSDTNAAEVTYNNRVKSFSSTGFTVGKDDEVDYQNKSYASWTFRKQKGFFDIVTYTGNGQANRVVTHNLGSVPGCIMIKRLTGSIEDWRVYHRGTDLENPGDYYLRLNQNHARNNADTFMDTIPTSTQFLLNSYSDVNANGETNIAYIFAGGALTTATARSVYFGGDASLVIPSSSDLTLGTGDFTIETWVYPQSFGNRSTIYDGRSSGGTTGITIGWEQTSGQVRVYMNATNGSDIVVQSDDLELKQWTHIAVTRSSGTVRLFINGVLKGSATRTSDLNNTNAKIIGFRSYTSSSYDHMHGQICNFRLVKGTAVYTSSFKPSTQPLTDITNTKLLCCNNVSVTGATVTPGTITVGTGGFAGNPVARASNPFDDPEGFKFGEEGDQNIITPGSYTGNGSSTGPEVYLGFEPQWLLIKGAGNVDSWVLFDSMRGIVVGDGYDMRVSPNLSSAEETDYNYLELTPTGFKLTVGQARTNGTNVNYVYVAIRRPDGYVGKPQEVGTGVFAMDTGSSSSTIPTYDSGFPVDFQVMRKPATTDNWYTGARLSGNKYLETNSHNAEASASTWVFDSNTGWSKSYGSNYQSWMWKRHAGFDVVTYVGNLTTGHQIPHSLNKVPEMIWLRCRTITGRDWVVYHKGCNGGVNPWLYRLRIDHTDGERSASSFFGAAPTTTNFTVGASADSNGNGDSIIAFLFSSIDGISKVGYYDGSATSQTITTGFQPRMVIIKAVNVDGNGWILLDTTRGWGAGNDKKLELDTTGAQSNSPLGAPTATGFTLDGNSGDTSTAGRKYIYYAHA